MTPKSILKVGHVSTLSGPVASSLAAISQGVQLWAKWVNANGGVNGHQVQVIPGDDAGDPARHKAVIKDLVENHSVVAFVGNSDALGGPSAVEYLESKRVPVVGVSGAEAGWQYTSPMYFPQASAGAAYIHAIYAITAQRAVATNMRKIGVLTCTEVQLCRDVADDAEPRTQGRGVQIVYKGRMSLAQPDLTAECLAARQAGAQMIVLAMDANSVRRVAASCARQGYRPVLVIPTQSAADSMKDEQNLSGTIVAVASTFPYFQANTPATAEFQSAMKRFGGGLEPAGGITTGWVSGKLFQRAGAEMPEPPSSAAVLAGLWSIKNDDLGGITQPLSFAEDQPAAPKACGFDSVIVDGVWVSTDAFKRSCDD